MNRSQEILDYLSSEATPSAVILAPNAPPVVHEQGRVNLILSIVLNSNDVLDTLLSLKSMTSKVGFDPASLSGTFSFGLRNVGRIRVTYLTQRGSKLVMVTRIPFSIPELGMLCDDPKVAERMYEIAQAPGGGLLTVSGPDSVTNSALVYALLDKVNQDYRKIIGVVENTLTYLMMHRNSIVVQCEVGTDVATVTEGVEILLGLTPMVLYVGGVRSLEDLAALACAAQPGRLIVLSSSVVDAGALAERFMAQAGVGGTDSSAKAIVRIAGIHDGKLTVRID